MRYLRIRNWEKFQHYKGKDAPPWIKLHRDLLSNYEFNQLSEVARGRLMRLWLLAASMKNRIPDDPAWVARQIGARTIDLDELLSRGFLEELYSDSREPLASAEQSRTEQKNSRAEQRANGSEEVDEHLLRGLLESLTDKDRNTERTIRKLVRQHHLAEGDLAWAKECAAGPGVVSPAAVAVSELKKRGLAKEAA